jgi:Ca-activated chloride channel family protein
MDYATIAPLADFRFLRPWWLLALPVLAWLAWAWRRRHRADAWDGVVDPQLREYLLEPVRGRRRWLAWWPWLGAMLALLALAGPSWQSSPQPLWETRAPLVIAVDLSPAMLADDLPPSRLARARARLAALLRERRGGEVGLVVYADDAYTVAPLTEDPANVAVFLDALEPGIMPGDAAAAAAADAAPAIDRAARLLRQAGFGRGEILLVSGSRQEASASAAATRAAAAGYRVSVLDAMPPAAAAASGSAAVAAAGRGRSAVLSADDVDLQALGVLHADDGTGMLAGGRRGGSTRRDDGYWLLLPLLVLAAFAFRRNGVVAVLALCLLVPWHPAAAAGIDWWQRSDQQAHRRLEQGAQAYRKGDYAAAAQAWRSVPGADAAYNLGNALARQGRYEDAIAAYDRALRERPGMADAIANRKAVQAAIKRKPPDKGRKPGPGDRGDGQRTPNGQQDDAGGQQAGDAAKQRADAAQQAADAARQAAARAAREREAARHARPGDQGMPQDGRMQGAQETPEQHERRLANQARLQRVPDDPGGLLRARLQLEYERRRAEGE